jgi:8-oxo-dGTP pyrophosphatase MutT (NUDIX family)/ribosomal protein S18 acetylase RimI-like enzyme
MAIAVRALSADDKGAVASLWQAANDARRREYGLDERPESVDVMSRRGTFAVGVGDGPELLSIAVAMPALGDDGRARQNVAGLAHISSVATRPDSSRLGYAARVMRAIMLQATRRGFARAQLWTHVSNTGARGLYERSGFEASGRQRTDDSGEPIMHLWRDLPAVPNVPRPAARIVCLDPGNRILLLHWRDPQDGYQLWEPPGGGIEPGESPYDAAVREWAEETGLPVPHLLRAHTAVARESVFNGLRSIVDEDFFLGSVEKAGEPKTDAATAVEQETYLGHAWVAWPELDRLEDPVEPELQPILTRLDPDGPWAHPGLATSAP